MMTLPDHRPKTSPPTKPILRTGLVTGAITAALLLGFLLGGAPWRYRKQLWQLQGGAIGLAAGYLIGRLGRHDQEND